MKSKVQFLLLPENAVQFLPSLSLVNEDYNKEYHLTKFKQFSKCGFGEISCQRLAISLYIWN